MLIADGLNTGAVAGSGSALRVSGASSCRASGSAGVNVCWESIMSSHMSRSCTGKRSAPPLA